ncbi:hypothetical protein CR983_02595 [Candidatus Saccharibacteria bacterium]|nr:MAG: hypothetical protein CR983_02595 [Candidatus Saccharibacteria bacterium]
MVWMDYREGLNKEQTHALDVAQGPLLILAGAGSGKTKTLTHRIAHLIAHEGVWPNQILAVTFTNKAAREMRERLHILLNQPPNPPRPSSPTRTASEQPSNPEGSAFPAARNNTTIALRSTTERVAVGGAADNVSRAATDNRQSSGYSAFPAEVGQGERQLAVRPYTRGLMGGGGGEAEAPTRTGTEQRSGGDGREERRGNEAEPSRAASDNHDTDEHSALPAEVGQDKLVISDRPYARGVMGGDGGEAETPARAASEQPSHPEGSAFPAERGQEDSNWRPRVPGASENAATSQPTIPRSFMPWMGTFHSICVRLLRMDGAAIGIKKNFVIYDEDDRVGLVKRVMKQRGITDKQIKPRAVSAAISSAKNKLIDPEAYAANAQVPFQQEVAKIYADYETERRAANALDFDDLLLETVRLLRETPDVRNHWRQHFRHILIDEYQDTNAAQYAIVKLLVNDEHNICVVGDDWQSIYMFRGADFGNILRFESDFPGTTVIKLEQNYRSTSAILDAAHQVISKNTQRTDKKLWTDADPGAPVKVYPVYSEADEAYTVASQIGAQVSIGARRYNEFAILYRTNAQSYPLERALLLAHIPYQIIGGVRFYDRAEIKDMVAYLRLLYQPMDTVSFSRIVNLPKRGLGPASVEKFLAWQRSSGLDIVSALAQAERAESLPARARGSLQRLGDILRTLQAAIDDGIGPSEILERLIEAIRYRDHILDGTPQAEDREANIGSLISDARPFASVEDFLEEVALMSSTDADQSAESVTLMTIHAAKGLEFPVVWIVGMEEGILPHARVFEGTAAELEEERRLCYVGMTRARQELHLSYARSRMQFGQSNYNMPSRFLSDIGDSAAMIQLDTEARHRPYDDTTQDMQPFVVGDLVRSMQFGDGEIIDVDGLAVTVQFDGGQRKKLNVEFARLEKR